ncbi:hypothetical protein SAMN02910278_01115 [Peptostreptococcus sp. D1]|nr:hypothetical protein SAMN02910278_01115 [Peptostreptococcus sp. D1]
MRAFALETDFGEGLMINDYIHNGAGNPKDIMKIITFILRYAIIVSSIKIFLKKVLTFF